MSAGRPVRGRAAILAALVLAAVAAGSAQAAAGRRPPAAPLAPGLFWGHAPRGRVSPDNTLTLPPGDPRGFVLLIHGGGWVLTGPATLRQEAATVAGLTALGWGVYDVDYRPGWLSVVDVVAAYDHFRRLHPSAPMCALGQSAGGQLAMLLAASRPRLRCVISEAGITDLATVPRSFSLQALMVHVFHGQLWQFSPVRLAPHIRGMLLCAGSSFDQVVPEAQQLAEIKQARPSTMTLLLAGEPTPGGPSLAHPPNFVHASITPQAQRRFARAVRHVLARAAREK